MIDRGGGGGRLSKQYKGKVRLLEEKIVMVLEGANIVDLVDTIEYLLKQIAKAEDTIGELHNMQPPAIERFDGEIRRLRNILDEHIITL